MTAPVSVRFSGASAEPCAAPRTHTHHVNRPPALDTWPDDVWRQELDCGACAMHLLLLLRQSKRWVVRRVERVTFLDDRTVSRRVTTDFHVPPSAPRLETQDAQFVRLIPLTVLRRKTLVNFGLQDGAGTSLSLVGMRQNQVLTERLLRALAEHVVGVQGRLVEDFCREIARGTQNVMSRAYTRARDSEPGSDLHRLVHDAAAGPLIVQLANNFLFLVAVPEEGPSRRIVRYRYDEPLSLVYKVGGYDQQLQRRNRAQQPLRAWSPPRWKAALGLSPTAVRFPVPAAEGSQSFHFEVEAPQGLLIASASLVAGRPGQKNVPGTSWDHVGGGFPVVGLHVCDVPNGSLSRAQVCLRLTRSGWLTSTAVASLLSTALLLVGALRLKDHPPADILTSTVLSITAAVIVFVVQRQEHEMASRLVSYVRRAGLTAVSMLVLLAVLVTFYKQPSAALLWSACAVSALCSLLVCVAWWRARPATVRTSPWEQGLSLAADPQPSEELTLAQARTDFGFHQPAIKVASSEGDHCAGVTRDTWDDVTEQRLCDRLRQGLEMPADERAVLPSEARRGLDRLPCDQAGPD